MFYEIMTWKAGLMDKLNAGELNVIEWQAFIKTATDANCQAMAANMQNRLDYYTKTKEQTCTKN